MAYIINFDVSNKADFIIDISATNDETGEVIDFTGAEVSVAIAEENCRPIITASVGNGITLIEPTVLELWITVTQMAVFIPASYRIGCAYRNNGITSQIFRGDFAVYEGYASI